MMTGKRPFVILSACWALIFLLNIDLTAMNLAISSMAHSLHATLDTMQWVINGFMLVPAMFYIIFTNMGDRFGHRRFFMAGIVFLLLGCIVGGMANSSSLVIVGRILQGFGMALGFPMAIVIANESYPKNRRGFVMGIIAAGVGLGQAIGPTIGAALIHHSSWRLIFFFNIPFLALMLIVTYCFCPKDTHFRDDIVLDIPGAILLALGLCLILIPINEVMAWGVSSTRFILFMSCGLLSFVLFAIVERFRDQTLIAFELFKHKAFQKQIILRLIMQFVFVPALFFIPLLLQNGAGYSILQSGYLMLGISVTLGLAAPIMGKIIDRIGTHYPAIMAMLFYLVACLMLSFVTVNATPLYFLLALACLGLASGTLLVTTITTATCLFAENKMSQSTAIMYSIAWFFSPIAIAVVGGFIGLNSEHQLQHLLAQTPIHLSSMQYEELKRVATGVLAPVHLSQLIALPNVNMLAKMGTESFMNSFHVAFKMLSALSLVGLLLALRGPKNVCAMGETKRT